MLFCSKLVVLSICIIRESLDFVPDAVRKGIQEIERRGRWILSEIGETSRSRRYHSLIAHLVSSPHDSSGRTYDNDSSCLPQVVSL